MSKIEICHEKEVFRVSTFVMALVILGQTFIIMGRPSWTSQTDNDDSMRQN